VHLGAWDADIGAESSPWGDDIHFDPLPGEPGDSADDLLNRLAGLPAWPEGDPVGAPPPPPPPPPPPLPRRFAEVDDDFEFEQPLPAGEPEGEDDLWGPGSGPVWSVGQGFPPPPPPPPPPSPPAGPGGAPFAPDGPLERDRRWDEPLEWETDEGQDGPAVRILGPDPFKRPQGSGGAATDVLVADPPAPAPPAALDDPAERPAPITMGPRPVARAVDGAGGHRGANGSGIAAATAPVVALPVKPRERPKPPPLAVVPASTPSRPHGRLGVLWVGVTVACLAPGPAPLGVWFALCAGLAGIQAAKVWKGQNEKPLVLLAGAVAASLPLAAIWGPRPMTLAVALGVVVTLLARLFSVTKAPARDVGLTLTIGVVVGLAVASVVLLRTVNVQAPLLLLAFAAAYDASAYVVGAGAARAWEGPVAGIFMLIPVTLLSAVTLVPNPFPTASPFLLGLIAAVLTPFGPLAGSALLGSRDAPAPALRRLDSLLVLAPVWAWCAAALLR